ncbi:nucleoside hydrolase [Sphingomonas sp. IC081]|uniref:nucleoside hydrolase n=1 Tax=Sphingomonas sp. IC081 TaxID=304378 RepID=UPI00115A4157|nr:nucleoside hydrolase [Sphingomonas sp. IC081]QDK34919.1 twin-arginine translocation pathway signal protein [Sphingomonas sp. IC081]
MGRRSFVGSTMVLASALAMPASAFGKQPALARVILDNDFAGDPDGLFQLAHHVLCSSVKIPLIVGSHLPARFGSGHDARDATARVDEVLQIMSLADKFNVMAGSETPIPSRTTWKPSAASEAIVREAMRDDAKEPLIYAAGAGLTDLALAWLSEPRIGRRVKLIWIGGNTHAGFGNPGAKPSEPEFNFSIDPIAAQVLFNESDIEIWQVPSDAYSQMLFSTAELEELGAQSRLGAYLKARVDAIPEMFAKIPGVPPVAMTDAYVLGDSPLVTLTALVPPMQPDATSSRYRLLPTPRLLDNGSYEERSGGRPMRVYTYLDAGLTFRDMAARFRLHSAA